MNKDNPHITFEYSFLIDLGNFFQTLFHKRWLDKHGYYYNLSPALFFKTIDFKNYILKLKNAISPYNQLIKADLAIILTRFGTQGSFSVKNKVILNVNYPAEKEALTLLHELNHIDYATTHKNSLIDHNELEKLINEKTQIQINQATDSHKGK